MESSAACFETLREYIESIPLIDCHDHSTTCGPAYPDAIAALMGGYVFSDLHSASNDRDIALMQDAALPIEQRWPVFEKAWKRTCHTGYAQVTKRLLKRFYGADELTLDVLQRMQDNLLDLTDEKLFDNILEEANIAARLANVRQPEGTYVQWLQRLLSGQDKLTPRARLVIPLPELHRLLTYDSIQTVAEPDGPCVTCLDEYLEACRRLFQKARDFGAVAFKDQSAYTRPIDYGNPSRAAAEEVFNRIVSDPRRSAAYPEGARALDDYLFHEFLRMARDLELPVQIHTGHMAGIRNDIVKTNAAHLTPVLELHRDVQFDLFHANWPYSGEVLYLAKNYPNVTIDFCWTNIIDPIYCQRMFKQALSCVPHGKIHGYGSDFGGSAERAWAHAQIARDNIAIALAEMVEMDYINLNDAKEIARAWLFDNANQFFKLGL